MVQEVYGGIGWYRVVQEVYGRYMSPSTHGALGIPSPSTPASACTTAVPWCVLGRV